MSATSVKPQQVKNLTVFQRRGSQWIGASPQRCSQPQILLLHGLELVSVKIDLFGRSLGDLRTIAGESLTTWCRDYGLVRRTSAGGRRPTWTDAELAQVLVAAEQAIAKIRAGA